MDHGLHPRRPLRGAHEQPNDTVKGLSSGHSQPQKARARKREVGTEPRGSPAVSVFNVLPLDSECSLACLYCVTHSTVPLRTCPLQSEYQLDFLRGGCWRDSVGGGGLLPVPVWTLDPHGICPHPWWLVRCSSLALWGGGVACHLPSEPDQPDQTRGLPCCLLG